MIVEGSKTITLGVAVPGRGALICAPGSAADNTIVGELPGVCVYVLTGIPGGTVVLEGRDATGELDD